MRSFRNISRIFAAALGIVSFATTYTALAQTADSTQKFSLQHSAGLSLETGFTYNGVPALHYDLRFRNPNRKGCDFALATSLVYNYIHDTNTDHQRDYNGIGIKVRATALLPLGKVRPNKIPLFALESGLELGYLGSNTALNDGLKGNYRALEGRISVAMPIGLRFQSPNEGVLVKIGIAPILNMVNTDRVGTDAMGNYVSKGSTTQLDAMVYLTAAYTFSKKTKAK